MAVKKATTVADLAGDGGTFGTVADGPTPTVPVGGEVPDTLNLAGTKPAQPVDEPVTITNDPWGSKVTVSSLTVQHFTDAGYKTK